MPTKEPSSRTEETTGAPLPIAEYVRRGNEYFNARRYDDALREYRAAQQLDPSNPDIYYLLGLVHERRGEYDAAREAFAQCTAGPYAAVARNHLKMLEKKRRKP
jgi:tetratricopeptide (TPR) repeat protein